MSLRCGSLYAFPKANPVPRWCWPVPTSGSWCQVVPFGVSWCWVVPSGTSWPESVPVGGPSEIGNVGYNPGGSVQDHNTFSALPIYLSNIANNLPDFVKTLLYWPFETCLNSYFNHQSHLSPTVGLWDSLRSFLSWRPRII